VVIMSENELNLEELKVAIDKFFDKKDVSVESRYFVTKMMNEEYWEQILNDGSDDPYTLEVDDDEGDSEPGSYDYENEKSVGSEEEDETDDFEEEAAPKSIPELEVPRPKKSVGGLFKKPVMKMK